MDLAIPSAGETLAILSGMVRAYFAPILDAIAMEGRIVDLR